jgi:hypothetical protein
VVDLLDEDEFERKFEEMTHRLAPLREAHKEIAMDDKVAVKARLDLLMLECMPDGMTVEEMMHISRAAFEVVMIEWKAWIQKGQTK